MALIKCPECNGQVSDKASACPHCGCPATEFNKSKNQETISETARCPICHNTITPEMKMCPVCHYGIPNTIENYTCNIDGRLVDLRSVKKYVDAGDIWNAQMFAISTAKLQRADAEALVSEIQREHKIPLEFHATHMPPTPKCPTCGSTRIEKLDAFTRGAALGLFGIASKTARSQFICKNCGYKW